MKRQTGPDLFSDPNDPANIAGVSPQDLMDGWRQPAFALHIGWRIETTFCATYPGRKYQAVYTRPLSLGPLNVSSPPPEATSHYCATIEEAQAHIDRSAY